MGFILNAIRSRFEEKKSTVLPGGTVMMISGCEDAQTSADVSNVTSFQLPDPAGRAGGACTSVLLSILYQDHKKTSEDLSFVQVLETMRDILDQRGFSQIPQLTSSRAIDVNSTFDLVPDHSTGQRRALLIGINYVGHEQGQLRGCHNDVMNMVEYIKDVHGFPEENITILMDDDDDSHESPTYDNIMAAYRKIIADSEPGDAVFCHYSGHGAKIKDDDRGEEEDGYDESLVPLDYQQKGVIRDDDLYDTLIRPLKPDVTCTFLMDCCHSGTVLDLPYHFKPNGEFTEMQIEEGYNFGKLFGKIGASVADILDG